MGSKKLKKQYYYDQEENKIGVILSPDEFEHLIDELEELYDWHLVHKRLNEKGRHYTHQEVVAVTEARLSKR